jgi:transcriptional regulator with XRE-family HTH domain
MTKQTYVPTEADRLTGENVRKLRRLAGETLVETIERSGVKIKQSSLSRIELGQRQLSMPEATKLAAHWNTTADKLFVTPKRPALLPVVRTEQEYLGNTPALFAVPDEDPADISVFESSFVKIDRGAPMTPDQYREKVWIPYLETLHVKKTA